MAVQVLKKGRKKWYSILASPEFRMVEIGETLAFSPESLIGRKITVNLMHLTNDIKKQSVKLTFVVNKVEDDRALTEIKKYEIVQASIKRLVHRDKDKVNDSFIVETEDKIKLRIKPVFVTKTKTKRSILAALRKKSREFLTEFCKNKKFSEIMDNLVNFRLQKQLKEILKKIYPVSILQIRCLEKR